MTDNIKLELEISLEDFFQGNRENIIHNAISDALVRKLNDTTN